MDLQETMHRQELVYNGIIVNVRRDQVTLSDGTDAQREVVEHPGGVAVFAMDEAQQVVMVQQYRYPMQEVVLELPAGKLEPGEDPRESALRELEEETGIVPTELHALGFSYSSPGIFTEKIYYYLATGLKQAPAHPDVGELLEVSRIPVKELVQKVESGELRDGKSIIGIMKAVLSLQREGKL